MPHVDGALSSGFWTAQGESRFARPVAAITAYVRRTFAAGAPPAGHADRETRQHEAAYEGAADVHDLERMQRDGDRRDVRPWGWR